MAPGLLSWPAWEQLRAADHVLAADLDPAWDDALRAAGADVRDLGDLPVDERAGSLVTEAAFGATVVWLGSPDGDPGLTDALAVHLSRHAVAGYPPQIEVLTGSHDVPGARLLDLVAVMDTLRSPGGCPWDAKQTHESLLPYLLEETHEVADAVESGDRALLREELGDLLLQVVFHSRVAAEHAQAPFDVDDVAAGIVDKLITRHPHVFGDDEGGLDGAGGLDGRGEPDGKGEPDGESRLGGAGGEKVEGGTEHAWERLKAVEKPDRGVFEGIPTSLPALLRAQKMAGRLERASASVEAAREQALAAAGDDPIAVALVETVLAARTAGTDAETTLRAVLTRLEASVPD